MPSVWRHHLMLTASLWLCFFASAVYAGGPWLDPFADTHIYDNVLVKEVLKADTLKLESGEIVRLIGIRAFGAQVRKKKVSRDEYGFVVKEKIDVQVPVEEQAFEFARELLEGKYVRLEFDAEQKDEDFRTLAYVFLVKDNTFVNAQLLARGFADLQLQAPNLKYAAPLREAYQQGRAYTAE